MEERTLSSISWLLIFFCLLVSSERMEWDGTLVFSDDFNGDSLRNTYWESEEGCEGETLLWNRS